MFKLSKLTTIFLILAAGLIGAYLIINNQDSLKEKGKAEKEISLKVISKSEEQTSINPIQWIENNTPNKDNFTAAVGQNIFEQIKIANPSDINSMNSIAGKLTKEIFANSQFNFNLISSINDADLKISSDISNKYKLRYLEAIKKINEDEFAGFTRTYLGVIYDVFAQNDSSSAIRLADIYKNLAGDYLNLAAPADWIDIHKKIIIHFKNSEIIYRAIADYSEDPVRGYLALEAVKGLADNAEQIQNLLIAMVQKINL